MELTRLYTLTGKAVTEQLGKVQDGERMKIEFRGRSADDSPVTGNAHGSTWILVGPMGPGESNAVQEIVTPSGERLAVELRGYAASRQDGSLEIRAAGIIRTNAASLAHLNGHVAVVVQQVAGETLRVEAYEL